MVGRLFGTSDSVNAWWSARTHVTRTKIVFGAVWVCWLVATEIMFLITSKDGWMLFIINICGYFTIGWSYAGERNKARAADQEEKT